MNGRKAWLVISACVGLGTASVRAEEFKLEIRAGIRGELRHNASIPIEITVTRSVDEIEQIRKAKKDIRAEVVVSAAGRGADKLAVIPNMILPPKSSKHFLISTDYPSSGFVVQLRRRKTVGYEDLGTIHSEGNLQLINPLVHNVLVPSGPGLLWRPTRKLRFSLAEIAEWPSLWPCYDFGDCVAMESKHALALSDEQRGALSQWVLSGGRLVLAHRAGRSLAVWRKYPFYGSLMSARNRAAVLRDSETPSGMGFETATQYGLGTCVLLELGGIGPSGQIRPGIWGKQRLRTSLKTPIDRDILRSLGVFPEADLPSFRLVAVFLGLYLVTVGPLNLMVLRRRRKTQWIWFSSATIILLFFGASFVVGILIRGASIMVSQFTLAAFDPSLGEGAARTFVGVFAPASRRYDIGFNPEPAGLRALSETGYGGWAKSYVEWGTPLKLRRMHIAKWTLAGFEAKHTAPYPRWLKYEVRDGRLTSVHNDGGPRVVGLWLVTQRKTIPLGALAPGDRRSTDQPIAWQPGATRAVALPDLGGAQCPWPVEQGVASNMTRLLHSPGCRKYLGLHTLHGPWLAAYTEAPLLNVSVGPKGARHWAGTLMIISLKPEEPAT